MPRLEVIIEVEAGKPCSRRTVIAGDVLRIGSNEGNDIVIADPMVSRFHCEISRVPEGFRLVDYQSLNGTRLGEHRVRDADLTLPESRITIGQSVVLVRAAGLVASPAISSSLSFGALRGGSPSMRRLYDLLQRIARTDSTVLIEGESGTGKELITSELVSRGPRAAMPFLVVDCGALAPTLMESELFGHAKGAFTGAERQRAGVFEAATGGTVFLDEIGELPLEMQPKLLRVLETGELRRVGENLLRKVDVRVIAATNRKLEREVNQGRFREDLFFRLSVVKVRVPPLRERLEDLPVLVDAILAHLDASEKRGLFTPELFQAMEKHDWPGNVRELKDFVERRVVFEDDVPLREDVPPSPSPGARPGDAAARARVDLDKPFHAAKEEVIQAFEREYLRELLIWAEGNVSLAARKAKLDRMHLHKLLQLRGIRKIGSLG